MNRAYCFLIVLIGVMIATSCFAQSSSATVTSQAPILVASNYLPVTETAHDTNASADLTAQPQSVLPDAPSAIQTGLNFQSAQLSFNAADGAETSANESQTYDANTMSSKASRMTRMINGIMNRMDLSDLATPPGIRGNTGPSGDATFAMNQHLALIGAYEHNSRPSFDTMAFGVAFTFAHNAN